MSLSVVRSGRTRIIPRDPVVRRLASITLVNTFGNGLFMTLSALYFTRIVGLPVTQVGLGLTLAGGLGVVAGVPAGHAADSLGVRRMLVVLVILECAGTACYTLVNSFIGFLIVVCATTTADRASSAVRATLYAVALPAERRTQVRAYLRAITNVGIGAGAACAAIALQLDTRAAYVSLILVDAFTFVCAAGMLLRLTLPARPAKPPVDESKPESRRRGRNEALRDGPYLVITGLNAVLSLQFGLIEIGVPLWIVGHTNAPRAMVALTMLINTVLVVLLQVRASRSVTTVGAAARAARRAGLLIALSCMLFAGAGGVSAWVATAVLVLATVVQTLSEVSCSSAGWYLSYELADPAAPGAYQGVFNSGFALAAMLAPLVVTSTALRFGTGGWAILAGAFAVAGAAHVPVARWAERRHQARFPDIPDSGGSAPSAPAGSAPDGSATGEAMSAPVG